MRCLFTIVAWLFTISADALDSQTLPFHPYRKVADRYYDLHPLYRWIDAFKARQQRREEAAPDETSGRPLKDWMSTQMPFQLSIVTYAVSQVLDDGLLIEPTFYMPSSGANAGKLFFLRNYPGAAQLTDGQKIQFLALRCGNYKYTDTLGAERTVPLYDYGTPYNPQELLRERQRTNAAAQKPK